MCEINAFTDFPKEEKLNEEEKKSEEQAKGMTLKQLKEIDDYDAFIEFVTCKEAKERGIIPKDYHEIFEDHCECGSENIISINATTVMCCNPKCRIKMAYMMSEVFSRYEVPKMGYATCKKFVDYFLDEVNPNMTVFDMFAQDSLPYKFNSLVIGEYFLDGVNTIKRKRITLSELISLMAIPDFDSKAEKIFKKYNRLDELTDDIQAYGGLQGFFSSKGVYNPKTIFYFKYFIKDIADAYLFLSRSLVEQPIQTVRVCMTGHLTLHGNKIKKANFAALCGEQSTLPTGKRLFKIEICSAIQSVAYVIADYESDSDKYLNAKARELEEGRKILYTSDEFLDYIESETLKAVKFMNEEAKSNVTNE